VLGHDAGAYYRRNELAQLVEIHKSHAGENEDPLSETEARFLQGVLCLREKCAVSAASDPWSQPRIGAVRLVVTAACRYLVVIA
jgi:hypothetical protein